MTVSRERKNAILVLVNKLADSTTGVGPTMTQVAKAIGISRQRVHQLAVEMRAEGELATCDELLLPGCTPRHELEENWVMEKLLVLRRANHEPPNVSTLALRMSLTTSRVAKIVNRLKKKGKIHQSKWLVPIQFEPHTVVSHFWKRIDVKNEDECWLWTGSQTSGYGHLLWKGKCNYAHRVAYELKFGDTHKLQVGHSCGTNLCCNPKHLIAR